MRLHREGNLYYLMLFFLGILGILGKFIFELAFNSWIIILYFGILGIISILILQFFRKPNRTFLQDDNAIFAPCDGKVVVIEKVFEHEYLQKECWQISIFMSPLNVHSNHNPISGEVSYFKYHKGKYLVAWHPKSSTENERTSYAIKHPKKGEILLRQIAGAVARRIRWYIKPDDMVVQNKEFGFIKFGSRVDVFLPLDAKIEVNLQQKTTNQKTILARW